MTDSEKLEKEIRKSGLRKSAIAEQIGISYGSLRNKIMNLTEFKAYEIAKLSELLDLPIDLRDQIFFGDNVGKKSTNKRKED